MKMFGRIPRLTRTIANLFAVVLAVVMLAGPQARAVDPIRIGFGMALTGGLGSAGKAALASMEIWRDDINAKGGLLGRPVELVYYDDQTNPATVPGIYSKLINFDRVDLVVSGYGTNLIAPAMPIVMSNGYVFMTLFGLAVNERFEYPYYFQILPAGPDPRVNWSRNFFELAKTVDSTLKTVALVGADAEFPRNALIGARQNAAENGLQIVYDRSYPPATVDFTPIVRSIKATNPDVVFVASYPPDSAGMVRAINEVGLDTKLLGGSMVGLQYSSLQKSLGSMLNGIVNYDVWVPEPTLNFPGIQAFLKKYQAIAKEIGTDPLGHYLPPFAYAYLQILGQAVEAVGALDQETIGNYIRETSFDTVIGKVKFGPDGEWEKSRMLFVQYQGIVDNDLTQFETAGRRVVLYPEEWKSGDIIYPYSDAR